MSFSNYPAGVTGHEDHFGPQHEEERTEQMECAECGHIGDVVILQQSYTSSCVEIWECPACGNETETDITQDLYEEHLERQAEWAQDLERYYSEGDDF